MSEANNTALVQECYAAFGRGDVQTILNHLTTDIEWTLDGPAILPYAGIRRGHAQVQAFFEALATTQIEQKLTINEIIAQGDKVATTGRYAARVKSTGKRFDSAVAHVFTIRNGKIVRFQDFVDTAQMAEAYVGASSAVGR